MAPAPASARYVPLVAPAAPPERRHGEEEEEDDECCYAARARYVPLRRREHEEYAARRALFLQSYRFTTTAASAGERDDGSGLRGRVARRMRTGREAVARAASRARGAARWWIGVGVARAWRLGWWWRPRASGVGCFGHGRKLHYLHDFFA